MTYAQALKYFDGNASALARFLDIAPASVLQWAAAKEIPELRQYQLEVLTDGALRARRPKKARKS